jgi:crossover junction endodeoxyribonuclease RusA
VGVVTLTFTIPSPPSVNNLFANVPGKGRVKSERYRIWANAAGWAMVTGVHHWKQLSGPVAVEIISGNGRQDIDNCAKGILDLLTDMAVIADDKQIVDLRIMRGGKRREAIVTVRAA